MDKRTIKRYALDIINGLINEPTAASYAPGSNTPYLRHEITFFDGLQQEPQIDPQELLKRLRRQATGPETEEKDEVRDFAAMIQELLRKAIGHDGKNFSVEVSVSSGLGGRLETAVNTFVYSDLHKKPEEIQGNLKKDKNTIIGRLNTALDQGKSY